MRVRRLERGTRIHLRTQCREYTGTVLEGANYAHEGEPDNWHLIFVHDIPIPGYSGPGSWKQQVEGGSFTILPCWNCGKENPTAPRCVTCGQHLVGPEDSPAYRRFVEIDNLWGRGY